MIAAELAGYELAHSGFGRTIRCCRPMITAPSARTEVSRNRGNLLGHTMDGP